jgi:hypothetical protein
MRRLRTILSRRAFRSSWFNPTKGELLRWAAGDEEDAVFFELIGDHEMAARKRRWAAEQRTEAEQRSQIRYLFRCLLP